MRGTLWLVGYVGGAGQKDVWIKWIMLVYNISTWVYNISTKLILARGHNTSYSKVSIEEKYL